MKPGAYWKKALILFGTILLSLVFSGLHAQTALNEKRLQFWENELRETADKPEERMELIDGHLQAGKISAFEKSYLKLQYLLSLISVDPDKAQVQIDQQEGVVLKSGDQFLIGLFYDVKGNYFFAVDDCARMKECYEKVLASSRKLKELKKRALQIKKLGVIGEINSSYCAGEVQVSIDKLKKYSYLLDDESDQESYLFYLNTSGILHFQIGNYKEAIRYLNKALDYTSTDLKNNAYAASTLNNLATIYHYDGNIPKSTECLERAYALYLDLPIDNSRLAFMLNMATNLKGRKEFDRALSIAKETGEHAQRIQFLEYASNADRIIAEILMEQGKEVESLPYIQSSIDYSQSNKDYVEWINALELLSDYYFAQGDYQQGAEVLKKKFNLSDSINSASQMGELQRTLVEFEADRKEAKIELLNRENERNRWRMTVIVVVAVAILLILLLFWIYRRKVLRYQREMEAARLARAQVNPHFLNNAFTTIQTLVFTPDSEEKVLDFTAHVARFSRLMLESSIQDTWPLKNELEMLTHYADIFVQKFPGKYRFSVKGTIDARLQQQLVLPTAILQPIIENAFEYAGGGEETFIEIRLYEKDKRVHIDLRNNRAPLTISSKRDPNEPSRGSHIVRERIALFNKRSRNKIAYQLELDEKEAFSSFTIEL